MKKFLVELRKPKEDEEVTSWGAKRGFYVRTVNICNLEFDNPVILAEISEQDFGYTFASLYSCIEQEKHRIEIHTQEFKDNLISKGHYESSLKTRNEYIAQLTKALSILKLLNKK